MGENMNRRGVSPVIAVLLLVVIAVAAAVLTYIWILSYTGSLQQQSNTAQLQEKIKIDGVNVNTGYSPDRIYVYVRNIGNSKVTISKYYLLDTNGKILATSTFSSYTLNPGTVDTSTSHYISYNVVDGTTYTVKVVTSSGTEATYTFTYRA